jgi:hypothetical protein
MEIIRKKAEARARFPGGHTFFDEQIAPRLTKVRLGPRLIGFTESSIQKLIAELIAESADIVPAPLPTAKRKRGATAKLSGNI